jgi:hypothetical protein
MIPCSIPGCTRERPRYSPLCSTHKKVKARHGHPLQVAVKMKELEPYKKAVRHWPRDRAKLDSKDLLKRLWLTLVKEAEVHVHRTNSGRPFDGNELNAYSIILKVGSQWTCPDQPSQDYT